MADARHLGRSVLTVTGSRILGLVFTLVQVKLATNYLGATRYGYLTTATLFIGLMGSWADLGMGQVVVRRVSGQGAGLRRQVGLLQAVTFIFLVPVAILTNALALLLYRDTPAVVLGIAMLTVGLAATAWATSLNAVAQVSGRFGHFAASDLVGRVVALGIILLTIWLDAGLVWFFVAQLVIPLGQLAAMLLLARSEGGFRPIFHRDCWHLVKEALPLTWIMLVAVLYFNVDGIMLSKLSTFEQAGAYALGYKLLSNLTIISSSLATVMNSRLATEAAHDGEAFRATLGRLIGIISLVALPLSTLVWPVAADLVRFVGSEEMVPIAAGPLSFISVSIAIGMVTGIVSTALVASHQQGFLTKLNTVTFTLNVALNLLLIPRLAATGAAIALVVSEGLGLLACAVLLRRRFDRVVPWDTLGRIVLSCGVTLLAESFLLGGLHWLVRLVLVGAIYVLMVFLTRAVRVRSLLEMRGARAEAPADPPVRPDGRPSTITPEPMTRAQWRAMQEAQRKRRLHRTDYTPRHRQP